MNKQVSYKIVSLIFAIFVICFAIAFYAFSWTGPSTAPPICPSGEPGCDAPINIGGASQYKSGALGIGGVFRAYSNAIIDGNVGIGTTSPSQKLDVSGQIHATGDICTDAGGGKCLSTAGGGGAFGSWTDRNSAGGTLVKNTIYRVTSDGFVLAMVLSTGTEHIIYGYTDSVNATTLVMVGKTSVSGPNGYGGITMPVRKGDYWRVTHPATVIIRWLPIGSGVCEAQ